MTRQCCLLVFLSVTACGGRATSGLALDDDFGEDGPEPGAFGEGGFGEGAVAGDDGVEDAKPGNGVDVVEPADPPSLSCAEARVDDGLTLAGGSGRVTSETPGRDGAGTLGQSFTVNTNGVLAGLEVHVTTCDPTSTMTLHLYTMPDATRIAEVTRDGRTLCGAPLGPATAGAGYFELAEECIGVQAGEELGFLLTTADGELVVARQFSGNIHEGSWLMWEGGTIDSPEFRRNGGSDTLFQSYVMSDEAAVSCGACAPPPG